MTNCLHKLSANDYDEAYIGLTTHKEGQGFPDLLWSSNPV